MRRAASSLPVRSSRTKRCHEARGVITVGKVLIKATAAAGVSLLVIQAWAASDCKRVDMA